MLPETGCEILINSDNGIQFSRLGMGHNFKDPFINKGTQLEDVPSQILLKRMIILSQLSLKYAPDALIELQGFIQLSFPFLIKMPVVLTLLEFHGCFGKNSSLDLPAGKGCRVHLRVCLKPFCCIHFE